MENEHEQDVLCQFFWGGDIVNDPTHGITYFPYEPKAMYEVPRKSTLGELVDMLLPNFAENEGSVKLKLICRMPSLTLTGIKYHKLPINDDRTLKSVLGLTARFKSYINYVDIYVVIDTASVDALPRTLPQSGSFTRLLTQEINTTRFQPTMPVACQAGPSTLSGSTPMHTSVPISDPCIPNDIDRCNQPDYHDRGEDHELNSVGCEETMEDAYDDDNLRGGLRGEIPSPVDKDLHPTCGGPNGDSPSSNESDDEDWDLDCGSPGGEIPSPDGIRLINDPIPYFMNIGLGNDGSLMRNDIIPRGDLWTPDTKEFTVGMLFTTKESLQYAVKIYHTKRFRHFKVVESSPNIWVCKCVSECRWRLRAIAKENGYFVIKKYDGPHSCLLRNNGRGHKNLDSTLIAKHIMSTVREDPDIKIGAIIDKVKTEFNYTINYKKAWLARTKAIRMLFGDWDESYKQLPRFMSALQESNPGTIVMWDNTPTGNPNVVKMNYVFWAFKPTIDGFRFCRPVICIDSTHLYGKYNGKILVATGVTSNNKVFPLAFAIVDEESGDAWKWFLRNLRQNVVPRREGVTLISDRGTGIMHAVSRVWTNPRTGVHGYHRYCLRHLCANFYKQTNNTLVKDLVWHAGTRHQVRKLNAELEKIRTINSKVFDDLMKIDIDKWTLAHDGGRRWGIMTTNNIESFNGVLKGACSMPISACVELTFYRLVKFFADEAAEAHQMRNENLRFPPHVRDKLDMYQLRGNTHGVLSYDRDNMVFEVNTAYHNNAGCNRQTVKLNIPSCTCGKWAILKIPCSHMFAAASHSGVDWVQFVAPQYTMDVYMRVWDTKFEPIMHASYWPEYNGPTLIPVSNRLQARKRGRPKSTCI